MVMEKNKVLLFSIQDKLCAFFQIREIAGCACAESAGKVFPATAG